MRYLLTMAYDGSDYSGFQRQKDKLTIQGEIEKALHILLQEDITIHPSGRTDAKVHALNQKAHFDTTKEIVDLEKFKVSLNSLVLDSIYVKDIISVSEDFHARYNQKEKTYLYKILLSKQRDPFKQNYYYTCGYDIDLNKMQQACDAFVGERDFSSFCVKNPQIKSTVRKITKVKMEIHDNEIFIYFTGNGFLHNMVRSMVGTIIDVARGRFEVSDIQKIFDAKDHQKAGKTLTGAGLYLFDVNYEDMKN